MTYWFIFCKTDLLLQKQADGSYTIPCSEESPIELKPWTHVLNISPMEDGTEVKAFTIDTPVTDNPNYEMCGLRPSYYKLSRDLYLKAGKCHELIYWDQNTQFCGICGAPMKMSTDISKKCTQCGKSVWPSLATAIIVLIHVLNISPMEDGTEVKAFTIDTPVTDNPNYEMCGLRPSYYKLSRDLYLKAGKCHELIYWDQNTQFCGICGAPMKMSTDISKKCTQCGKSVWPSLATAIIVLIRRGEEVLLVHARNFKSDFYGLVAGFVETGETLEQAVHREVMEETGLTINHLKYFGSQPWPYPSGLMVGFTADYVDGEIHLQKEELSRGKWFTKYNLPTIPEKLSIARQIIDAWLEEQKSNL